jgi:hypothetical protein
MPSLSGSGVRRAEGIMVEQTEKAFGDFPFVPLFLEIKRMVTG